MKIKVTERLKKGITIEYGKRTNKNDYLHRWPSFNGRCYDEGAEKDFGGSSAPDETIDVEELKIKSLRERYKWLNWPFIRGVIAMYESMTIGFKALGMSADKSLPEDEEGSRTLPKI